MNVCVGVFPVELAHLIPRREHTSDMRPKDPSLVKVPCLQVITPLFSKPCCPLRYHHLACGVFVSIRFVHVLFTTRFRASSVEDSVVFTVVLLMSSGGNVGSSVRALGLNMVVISETCV